MSGLTDTNKRTVFPTNPEYKVGDLVSVKIYDASQNTLFGEPLELSDTISFHTKYRTPNTN